MKHANEWVWLQRICAVLAALFLCAVPSLAQVQNGVFTGTVTDPQGASIPGAEVTVTNTGTNYSVTVKTNNEGVYRTSELPAGQYKITVTVSGFKTAVRPNLTLNVGTIQRIDFPMALGEAREQVVVEAGVVAVNTEDSRLYESVTGGQVGNLPLNGRNVFDLIQLAPGALNVAGVSFENGQDTVVNGLRPNFTGFLINGVSNKGLSGGVVTVPNADIVEEFQELTLNMSAQYGNSAAAVVNVITKSGTNAFHGSAYEFFRNDVLDANDFFRNQVGEGKPPLRFNQFGATLNGPIFRDKLFFSISYQGERFTTNASPVPIEAEAPQWRQAVISAFPNSVAALIYGNFPTVSAGTPSLTLTDYVTRGRSGSGFRAFGDYFCPANYPSSFQGLVARFRSMLGVTAADQTYLTGTHPTSPTDPTPVPNCSTFFGVGAPPPPAVQAGAISRLTPFLNDNILIFGAQTLERLNNGNEWSTRIDWNRKSDRVSGEFYWQKFNDRFGPANASSGIHGFRNPQEIYSPNFSASWVHTFSPNWLNEARVGFVRSRNDIVTAVPGVPSIGFDDGSAGFGSYNGYPQLFRENIYSYSDIMSFSKGKHNIKAGVDFRRNLENSEFNVARPSYYFLDQLFFALDAPYGEVGGVDPGFASNRPAELATNRRNWRNLEVGAYFQDDWKVRPNLTINVGLRFDLFTRHKEASGKITTFVPGPGSTTPANGIFLDWIANANVPAGSTGCTTPQQIAQVVLAGVCGPGGFGVANALGGSDHNNFGPRVGFAWDPFSTGKTSIRAGFGISYEGTLYNPLSNSRWNPPFYSFNLNFNSLGGGSDVVVYGPTTCTTTGCSPSGVAPTFSGSGTNPGQGIGDQATGNIIGYFSGNSNAAFLTGIVFPEGIKDPYIINTYFGVQREILRNTVVEVTYVGTQGRKLFRAENVNRAPGIAACLARDAAGDCIPGTGFGPNATFQAQGRTLTALNRRSLNPNYGTLRAWLNVSKSWYNALQVSVRQKMTRGLMFNVNYAWSHSIDTGSTWHSGATTANGAAAGEGFSMDVTRPELDRGNSVFDIRHRLVFNYVWELPWYKDQQGVIGHILGGWQYNGIWSFQSGAHFSPFCAVGGGCDFNRNGERNDRPDAPNGNSIDVTREMWANGWFPFGSFGCAFGADPSDPTACQKEFFTTPCLGCNGNLGRNTFEGPGQIISDQSVFKNIRITERWKMQFRFETFNAFNRANFTLPNSATGGNRANRITSGIFGKSNGTLGPRRIQFGVKFLF